MQATQRDETRPSRLAGGAAILMVVAGLVHLLIIPHHWSHAPAHGLLFAAAGVAEVGWALAFWRRPAPDLTRLGLILSGGLVVLWVLTRLMGAPFGHETEALDRYHLICKTAEALAAVALVILTLRQAGRERLRGASRQALDGLVVAVMAGSLTYAVGRAAEPVLPWLASAEASAEHTHAEPHGPAEPAHDEAQDHPATTPAGSSDSPEKAASPAINTETAEAADSTQELVPSSQTSEVSETPEVLDAPEVSDHEHVEPAGEHDLPAVAAEDGILLEGSGEAASEKFALAPGLVVVEYAHPTNTPFALFLLNTDGDHLALFANATSAVTATQLYGIQSAGEYYLHAIASDDWSARVSQPVAEGLRAQTTERESLAGTGPSVSGPISLPAGALRVRWSHEGALLFRAVLWSVDGQQGVEAATINGPGRGEREIGVPAGGVYLFNVLADGPWTLSWDAP